MFLCACSSQQQRENRVAASFHAEELPADYKADLGKRLVFPFSVVPGGTVSKQEVQHRVAADPVVRQHYAGLQFDKLKPFRLTQPGQGYVSYRIGNKIFWTSRRLYLKPGEVLLSDGINVLRGRCGNRVSATPQTPTLPAPAEPTEAALDLPRGDQTPFEASKFALSPNLPAALPTMEAKVPESAFEVAPKPYGPGPGMIGGGLPGGLPPTGKEGEIVLQSGYFWLFPYQPSPIQTPAFNPPVNPPLLVVVYELTFPSPYYSTYPIGVNGPSQFYYDYSLPYLPGFETPWIPPLLVSGGTPPFVYYPPNSPQPPIVFPPILPPGTSLPPPSVVIEIIETNPPPDFEHIPEPSTAWMVGLAAALWFAWIKRRP